MAVITIPFAYDERTHLTIVSICIADTDSEGNAVHRGWIDFGVVPVVDRFFIYDCITFETTTGNTTYVLTGGAWFQVAKTLNDRVNIAVQQASEGYPFLVPAGKDEYEASYNKRIGNTNKDVVLLDQHYARCIDSTTDIEIADLLTKNREFIHLKRKTRSATLSHLFAQGAVSGEAFLRDEQFRQQTRDHLTGPFKSLAPNTRPDAT